MTELRGKGVQVREMDDAIALLTVRYRAACSDYQAIADRNTELTLTGERPSKQARFEEERAFEELDVARHALLNAAALVYPMIH